MHGDPTVAPGGDGTASGIWPNAVQFSFTGNRIGGTLQSVTAFTEGDDPFLYDTGKGCLTGAMARAAAITGDPAMRAMAIDLARLAIDASQADGGRLGKIQVSCATQVQRTRSFALISSMRKRMFTGLPSLTKRLRSGSTRLSDRWSRA